MATYLQLCQQVTRDSGTVSGTQPTSVTGQVGRLAKIVAYVADAWVSIQNDRNAWRWMRREFTGSVLVGTSAYTAASWDIADLAEWIVEPEAVTLYDTAIGVADERPLRPIGWDDWRRLYGRGAQTPGPPQHYAVRDSDRAFLLGPVPDTAYTIGGLYRKRPQVLAANTDVPECPTRFHDTIRWRALMLLDAHDEAPVPLSLAAAEYAKALGALERDQLPMVRIGGGPLA